MKKAWMDYYLINTLRKSNKFFTDNWFSKTIIKENKDKVKPLANAILDKFLRKTVILNIILFAKTREIMARKSDTINHDNYYLVINNIVNVLKLAHLLKEDNVFEKQLGQMYKAKISNLFACKTAKIGTRIPLYKYQICTRRN